MGCCFSNEDSQRDSGQAEVTSPLLGHLDKPAPSTGTGTGQPGTARRYRATDAADPISIAPISVRPVKVSGVDKRIQDHAQLYNDHVERRARLQDIMEDLRERFPEDNTSHTLQGCFSHLRTLCRGVESIQVTRKYQYCMEIQYEGREVHHHAIEAFLLFNKANKLIKDIMDKGPALVSSVELVISNERELRREVLVASLGEEGPQCMKNCMENVTDLKKVPAAVEDIKLETMRAFEDLKNAAGTLMAPPDGEGGVTNDVYEP